MTLRLMDLETPLDDVEFPNGSKHVPVPFGPAEYKLWREIGSETEPERRGMMLLQIVKACYPTATDDDFDSCTAKMLIAMAAHAGRKIDQVRDALKNVGAVEAQAAAAPPSTPSSPTTSGNTSSPKSRTRSAKTGGERTTVNPTDAPSSSGTPTTDSTSQSASTPFAVKWTTSTAPSSLPPA